MYSYKEDKKHIENLIENGMLVEAKAALEKYKFKYSNNTSSSSLEALICILESDYQKARLILLQQYDQQKIDYDILYELGMVSELLGDYDDCIKYYIEAKKMTGNNADLDNIIDSFLNDITNDIIKGKKQIGNILELLKKYGINIDSYLMKIARNKYPKAIIIETIRGCNLECIFCPLQVDPNTKKHGLMDDDTFNNILNTVITIEDIKLFILHNLGEPLLDQSIFKRVRSIKELKADSEVLIDTNFSVDFDAFALVNSGLDTLDVAFDGANQKTYSKYRKNGSLDKVISNIVRLASAKRELNSQKPAIVAKTVIFKHLVDELELISNLARQAGADNYMLQTALFKENTGQDPKEWIPEHQNLTRYDVEKLYKADELVYHKNSIYQGKDCSGILEEIPPVIDFEGNVYPCCYISTEEKFNMGNVNIQSFKEIWESDKYTKFRSDVTKDRFQYDLCKNCCRPSNQS